jgi:hypothetical protein
MSILNSPPSFAPAGVALHLIALPLHPILSSTPPPLDALLPQVTPATPPPICLHPDWLPCCLLWHLCLTSASSPSPPPPPLVESCSRLPWLVVVLSPSTCDSATATPHCPSSPWLVVASSACSIVSHCCCVASPHVVPLPPILPFLGLLSSWLLHCLPLVWLVVAPPLLMLPPPICWRLRLSLRCRLLSCPSPCHCLSCL